MQIGTRIVNGKKRTWIKDTDSRFLDWLHKQLKSRKHKSMRTKWGISTSASIEKVKMLASFY